MFLLCFIDADALWRAASVVVTAVARHDRCGLLGAGFRVVQCCCCRSTQVVVVEVVASRRKLLLSLLTIECSFQSGVLFRGKSMDMLRKCDVTEVALERGTENLKGELAAKGELGRIAKLRNAKGSK